MTDTPVSAAPTAPTEPTTQKSIQDLFHRVDLEPLRQSGDPRLALAGIHNSIVAAVCIEFSKKELPDEQRETLSRCIAGYWTAARRDVKEAEAMAIRVLETFQNS